ncbi:hypothetical protein JRO89_XS05G0197200 [Xanthoceras sorbifolium]|uniref:Inositol polyphosphate-related phosphatase domain-containing protein n=1 Tax=Xanthoceras sorbifolium TaxID=99658 RepID=A0ABQ8I2H0_9ROSI|nr:hypothetical protein JRO89_XS05G0197200 [Xanthoceras sorbifolium]
MWPRLVANKFLMRKGLGSNNFVADFPSSDNSILDIPSLDEPSLSHESTVFNHHKETHNYRFQEIVPLRASNVLGSENNKIFMKWNSLIRETLNKKSQNDKLEEIQCVSPIKKGKKLIDQSINVPQDFRCIISKQMVGIFISVWVRNDLHPYIRHPSVSCVGCGIMGCLGNKGSVSIRFQLHETSFCFICSHLASGGKEGDEKHRNSDVAEIFSRTSFPAGGDPSLNLPRNILDHDRVIFLGDLNYRISLPEATTRLLVDRREWNTLLENDQDGADEWSSIPRCDRIIWYGKGLKQHIYGRGESNLSDHRPVKAIFTAQVQILRTLKDRQASLIRQ